MFLNSSFREPIFNLPIHQKFQIFLLSFFTILIFLLPGVNLIAALVFVNDKEAHLSFFLVLALYRMIDAKNYRQIVFTNVLLGVAIEFFQYFEPNRSCDMNDIAADTFGTMIAYFFRIGFDEMPILNPKYWVLDFKF